MWIRTAPRAELSSIFVRLPLAAPISGETRPCCGYSDWGGVGHDEALQADDHVVASFGDDLPNILAVLLQLLPVPPLELLAGAGSSSGSQCSARTARCTSCVLRAPTPLAAWSSGSGCYRRAAASSSPFRPHSSPCCTGSHLPPCFRACHDAVAPLAKVRARRRQPLTYFFFFFF